MNILVPIRYPLTEHSRQTLQHAIVIAEREEATLYILHIRLLHENPPPVRPKNLQRAVEGAFGPLTVETFYRVRNGFLLEELLFEEAFDNAVDLIVIGQDRRQRWHQSLRQLLNIDVDIETYLQEAFHADLEVV